MNDNKNKIGSCDKTLNPVVGCLGPDGRGLCPWCFAKEQNRLHKIIPDFTKPQFFPERLEQLRHTRKSYKIFINSMSDLFGPWVPEEWREYIFAKMREFYWHQFQALTKSPSILSRLDIPENCWVGVSITSPADYHRIDELRKCNARVKFISAEPLMAPLTNLDLSDIDWLIVGAMTGPMKKHHQPEQAWVIDIIDYARRLNIPIFIKDNLNWSEEIKEFPKIKAVSVWRCK